MPVQTELRDLAGLPVLLAIESEDLGYLVDWHFGALERLDNRDAISRSLTLTIRRSESNTPPAAEHAHEKRIGQMTVKIGDRLRVEHDQGGVLFANASGAVLTLWSRREDEWLVFRQLMYVALSYCLTFHDRAVLHGALVSREGRGLLIVGGTGQGKSTFALAALLAGNQVHGDDMAIAMLTPTGPRLWGLPKRLAVPGKASHMLSDLGDLEPVPGDRRKRVLLPQTSVHYGFVDDVRVVAAGHHHDTGDVTRLHAPQTLAEVVKSFEFADEPSMLHRCFATLVGVGSLPGFVARHAADPTTRLDVARQLLDLCYDTHPPSHS